MKDRLRSMQRILNVQTQLHRLAQWKLAEAERRDDALRERQRDLLRFLDEEQSYTALLSTTLMRRLRSVGEERAVAAVAKQEQTEKVIEELRRSGRMQNMVEQLEDEARQSAEREELRDGLEQLTNRRHASPR